MGWILPLASLLLCRASVTHGQEFKKMPDLRGQSFGLENFLLQPFNLASQDEEQLSPPPPPPKRMRERRPPSQYTLEFQVQNDDFDMRKISPKATPFFPNEQFKPVHEFSEPFPSPMPPRRGQSNGESDNPNKRRLQPPETRRPLEKPSEFMVSITENVPFPSNERERPRKRVMKRRRKKPSTMPPEVIPDSQQFMEPTKEDIPEDNMSTSTKEMVKDVSVEVTESAAEFNPQRRKPGSSKRQRQPAQPVSTSEPEKSISPYEDSLLSEASQKVSQKNNPIPETKTEKEPTNTVPVTEQPNEPTQQLKNLLKQQNGQLSLSEILQTQNLSLADLLRGNPGALSALGANKVNENIESTTSRLEPETQKPQVEHKRPHNIPKISLKSRPFSKPFVNGTKTARKPSTTEETSPQLPKKLDIIEVTSDRPTYNGFTPKKPRTRGGQKVGTTYPKVIIDEAISEKPKESEMEEHSSGEIDKGEAHIKEYDESSVEMMRASTRSPIYRLSTVSPSRESSNVEHKVHPKLYSDYKPKSRLDRRKYTTEPATEPITTVDSQETTLKLSPTTEQTKTTKELRNRVRIPFMSVNNPDISVILPQKKVNLTTEKPRTSPVIKDRINIFKRLNDEKQVTENTATESAKETETSLATPTATSPTETVTTTRLQKTTSKPETDIEATTIEEPDDKESSDEIVELLKSGNNAQRLKRILAARNMTVMELLEKRADSSKQPNVTKLFEKSSESQLSETHKVSELHDNYHPSSEKTTTAVLTTKRTLPVFPEFPNFKIDHGERIKVKPETAKPHDSNAFDELFVDESVIRPIRLPFDNDEKREPKAYEKSAVKEVAPKSGHRVYLNLSPETEGKPRHPMPLWNVDEKSIYSSNPYGYPTYDLNNNLAGSRTTTELPRPTEPEIEPILFETIARNLDAHHRLKTNINDILKEQVEQVQVVKEVREDVTFIPPAVKSAIIASGVVMGIALLLFVAIFAACGWKQRQFRLRAGASILNDSLNGSAGKTIRRTGTLSPVSFKRSSLYKKSIDFEDTESSVSGSSNTSSYLWNTLKHTFQSRNSTLKNRQEKEEKIQEREIRSRRNTLSREDDRGRKNTLTHDDSRRDSFMVRDELRRDRDVEIPRRNTLTRDEQRRDSVMTRDALMRDSFISRDTPAREDTRRASCYRDDNRRISSLLRDNERCSLKKIDPDRNIIQTSMNFKRGGFNGSSRHFDSCDHFN